MPDPVYFFSYEVKDFSINRKPAPRPLSMKPDNMLCVARMGSFLQGPSSQPVGKESSLYNMYIPINSVAAPIAFIMTTNLACSSFFHRDFDEVVFVGLKDSTGFLCEIELVHDITRSLSLG